MQNLSFLFLIFFQVFWSQQHPHWFPGKLCCCHISIFCELWIHMYKKNIHLAEKKVKYIFFFIYKFQFESHRVDRVMGFFSCCPNRDSPTPSPAGECVPPPLVRGGGGFTLACGRGGWCVPIPTRGQTLWYSSYICTLCWISSSFKNWNPQPIQIVFERHCFAFLLMLVHIMKETPNNGCTKTQVKKFRKRCKKRWRKNEVNF